MSNRPRRELLSVFRKAVVRPALLQAFLTDLLTPKEYREIITRWQIVQLLRQGMPQRRIAKKLRVSIGKITRGSRTLLNKHGGFRQILK